LAARQSLEIVAPAVPPDELAQSVARAQSLALEVRLDEAAALLDRALADVSHRPDRAEPGAFIGAHIARVSIAFARGETERARELLDRVVRFDPFVDLSGDEDRPRMRAALEAAKRRERPPLSAEDLGDACKAADVVLVARALSPPAAGASALEFFRFDRGQLVAHSALADDRAVSALARAPAPAATPPARQPVYRAPLGLGLVAVAVAATGAGLWGSARADYDRLNASPCGLLGVCQPSSWDGARARERAGYSLVAIAGATAAVSLIVWLVERRRPPPLASASTGGDGVAQRFSDH
jgi:hypothetical protein